MISFFKQHNTLSVFLFVLCVNLFFYSGHIGGDAIWNYLTAQSLFTDGNLNLADSMREIEIDQLKDAFTKINNSIEQGANLHNGEFYSIYGLGSIILGVIFYVLGLFMSKLMPFLPEDYFLIFIFSIQNVFIAALTALIYYKLILLFSQERKTALLLTLGLSFGTITITYALKSGFGEPLAGLIVLSSFYVLNLYDRNKNPKLLLLSGFLTGFFVLTKLYTVVLFPAFFIFLLLIIEKKNFKTMSNQLLLFTAGFVIPVAIFFLYNYMRFDNIFEAGYAVHSGEDFKKFTFDIFYAIITVFNIFFSTGKGILLFNPLIILSIFGLRNLFKNHRNQFIFYISALVPYVLFFSAVVNWPSWGAWGSRYFIPLLGILIFPAVFIFENIQESSRRRFVKALYVVIILGIFIQLPSVLMNYSAFERFLEKECPHSYRTRINMPQYSQIIGGYYQLYSGINRIATGESIDFPLILSDNEHIDLAKTENRNDSKISLYLKIVIVRRSLSGYDWFDIWFIHLLSLKSASLLLKITTLFITAFLAFFGVYIYRQITTDT